MNSKINRHRSSSTRSTSAAWVLLFSLVLLFSGCTHLEKQTQPDIPEIYPGILAGYLKPENVPDSALLLPPPPETASLAFGLDQDTARKVRPLQNSSRWSLAIEDANLTFPKAAETFSCAVQAPITGKDTPRLYRLLRRTLTDSGLSTYHAKNLHQRARPFTVNKESSCTPEAEAKLGFSYPSGHSAVGWAWALILSEIAPDRTNVILVRGLAYGQSRVVCGVHWLSDVIEGRLMGAATVARLHADPVFQADLEAAKIELAAVRAKGLKPTRDCRAEAEALALLPPLVP
jgi:acid phosphatase (class A)